MRRSRQPVTPRSSQKRRRRRIGALLGSVVLIVVIGGVRWRRDRLEFVMLLDEHTGTTLRRLPHNASLVGETESAGLWADGSKAPGFDNGALHPAGVAICSRRINVGYSAHGFTIETAVLVKSSTLRLARVAPWLRVMATLRR